VALPKNTAASHKWEAAVNNVAPKTLARAEGADRCRQPLFEQLGAFPQVARRRRGGHHQRQRDHGKTQPGNASRHQHAIGIGNVQAEDVEGDMFERFYVLHDRERKQKEHRRQRGQHGQRHIERTMELLPRPAMRAFLEVLLVVLAHLRRNAGNVISPARQNVAYDSISAMGSCHKEFDSLFLDLLHSPHLPNCCKSVDRNWHLYGTETAASPTLAIRATRPRGTMPARGIIVHIYYRSVN